MLQIGVFVFNALNREQHDKRSYSVFSPLQASTSELLPSCSSSDDGNCECGRSPEKEADGENIDLVNDSCMPRRFTSKTASTASISLQSFDKKCTNKESFQIYAHRMLQAQSVRRKTKPIVDTMLTCVEHGRSGEAAGTENEPRLFTIWDVGAGSGAVYLGLLLKEDELIKRNVCVHLVAIDADEHMVDFLSGMAEKESISLSKDENHKAWDISSDASPRISANSALVTMTVHFGNALNMSMDDLPPCDILVLNSVVHEIISYGEVDKEKTRYNRDNIRVFLNNFANSAAAKKGTAIFFRDFILPPKNWVQKFLEQELAVLSSLGDDKSLQYVIKVIFKTETSRKHARVLWEDLAKRYKLKEAYLPATVPHNPESELILNIDSVMEMVASWYWAKMDAGTLASKLPEISTASPSTPPMTLPSSISTTMPSIPSSCYEELALTYDSAIDEQFCNYSLESFSELMAELGYFPMKESELKTYTSEKYVTTFVEDFNMELLVWGLGCQSHSRCSEDAGFRSFPIQGSDLPDLKASVVYKKLETHVA